MYINSVKANQSQSFKAVKIEHRDDLDRMNNPFWFKMKEVLKSQEYPKSLQIIRTRRFNTDYDYIYLFFGLQKKDEDTFMKLVQSQDIKAEQTDFFFIGKDRKKSMLNLEPKRRDLLGLNYIELRNCEKIDRSYFI